MAYRKTHLSFHKSLLFLKMKITEVWGCGLEGPELTQRWEHFSSPGFGGQNSLVGSHAVGEQGQQDRVWATRGALGTYKGKVGASF